MLIFFHGTGDDDSKSENFIPAIAKLLRDRYGEIVLVMPGVSSAQRNQIGTRATECLELIKARSLHEQWQPLDHNHNVSSNPDGLNRAIQQAKSSAFQYSTTPIHEVPDYVIPGGEAAEIQRLIQSQRGEGYSLFGMVKRQDNKQSKGVKSVGIKTRMSIAALCAVRYKRLGGMRPLRIVGHSRGGSAAIGAHNLIAYHGFEVDKTLTLDPCHGLLRMGGPQTLANSATSTGRVVQRALFPGQPVQKPNDIQVVKDYYSKIWNGRLVNLPCEKGVAHDTLGRYLAMRPVIEWAGTGMSGCENLPKLKNIRHGHMGKFLPYPDEKVAKMATKVGGLPGYGNVAIADGPLARFYGLNNPGKMASSPKKKVWQQNIQNRLDAYIENLKAGVPLDVALRGLFKEVDPRIVVQGNDMHTIIEEVVKTICFGFGEEMPVSEPNMNFRNASFDPSYRPSNVKETLLQDEGEVEEGFPDDEGGQTTGSAPFRFT